MSHTLHRSHRDTIHVETAVVLEHERHAADQHVIRLQAPHSARHAQPGSFVHVRCSDGRPMRRPLSIQRADADSGWIEILFKVVGDGTSELATAEPGAALSVIGPIGRPFEHDARHTRPLLIGGGVGIPPMVFLAERLRAMPGMEPFAAFGSEVPFPFHAIVSRMLVPGMPHGVTHAAPLLESWGVPSRLASRAHQPGTFHGFATELAQAWLDALPGDELSRVCVYACGPHAMLQATVALAARYALPCQISLEEYMACAVGGCAGCTVEVLTPTGPSMKRVCVDGPVFDGYTVYPALRSVRNDSAHQTTQ
ncbi:MAG: dihydroorotate dehydrogenase electron transfer subunit [Chromatiales bacterium]|nr:dihydroorotate dehydrogenase electron transfer subunit [Chromatiales bacterium]